MSPDIHELVVAYSAPIVLANGDKPAFFHFEIPLAAVQNLLQQSPSIDKKSGDKKSGDKKSGDKKSGDKKSGDKKSGHDRLLIVDASGLILADTNRLMATITNAKANQQETPRLQDYLPNMDKMSIDANFLRLVEQIKNQQSGQGQFVTTETEYQIVFQPLGVLDWSIAIIKPHARLLAGTLSYDQVIAILILTPLLMIVFGAGVGYFLAESLARPIRVLDAASREISQGKLELVIQVTGHDEIGRLATTFKKMMGNLDLWQRKLITEQEVNRQKDALLLQTIKEASRAKSDFIANLSHEIRTPMNAIMGLADLALRSEPDIDTQDYLEKIETASHSLMACLDDILDFSKIDAGKLDLYPAMFNPHDLFSNLSDIFSSQVADKDLELVFSTPQNYFNSLFGDAKRLQQVFINLLRNAIKFTNQGTIFIKAHAREVKIGPVELEFSIQDTGIGIDPERIKTLFQPFVQADPSIAITYGGSGLGLNICKQLLEMMGGRIWATSVLGQGSVFHFTVSMVNQTETSKNEILPSYLQGIRILVVDDHDLTREIMEEMLLGFRFFARSVDSGEMALTEILTASDAGKPFDLVFMDWRMPGMDGLETAMAIRTKMIMTKPDAKRPKIVMLTAFGKSTIQHYAKSSGIDLFLHKPVSRAGLYNAIQELFGEKVAKKTRTELAVAEETAIAAKIGGANVLLAEDNRINQQVAQEILERVGIVVKIAHNGKKALHMLEQTPFDLVLMDVQMPVMNGYAATTHIRKDPRFAALPIIAMTAHVLASAREKCFNSGMNDYVTKPIHVHHFYETLVKWLNPGGSNARLGQSLPACTRPVDDVADYEVVLPPILNGIDMAIAMERFSGRQNFFKKMLLSFNSYTTIGQDISHALARNDIKAVKDMVHTMKGMAGNLAAISLYQAAKAIEQAIEQERILDEPNLLVNFEQALQQIIATVHSLEMIQEPVQEVEQHNSEPVAVTETLLKTKELSDYLQARDTDAEFGLAALKNILKSNEWQEDLHLMETQIDQFDYRGALATLANIEKSLQVRG